MNDQATAESGDRSTLVLDVGKTNVKLLVMSKRGKIHEVAKLDNRSLDRPPYPHLDTEWIWKWMMATISGLAKRYWIDAIVPTTHGCAAGLIDGDGLVLPILDYEAEIPSETAEAFETVRPSFTDTQCPLLPQGMNLARQLFWQQRDFPKQVARTRYILAYPQYWSWRLSGVAASELTSVGCHSMLWYPARCCFTPLVDQQGWRSLLPPMRPAYDALGPIVPQIAEQTGLPHHCQVYNGIHDSNAAYSLYLRGHPRPFSLVSTGTWGVMISPRLPLSKLNEHRDTLAMVDLLGDSLPTARFMGGREFELLVAEAGASRDYAEQDLRAVIAKRSFLLPSFAPGGPFTGRQGGTAGPELRKPGEIVARTSLYLAMMTMTSTAMLETDGDLLIDGGFVNNALYCRLLATLRGHDRCMINHQSEGTAVGAGMLAVWNDQDIEWPLSLTSVEKFEDPGLVDYVEAWQRRTDDDA